MPLSGPMLTKMFVTPSDITRRDKSIDIGISGIVQIETKEVGNPVVPFVAEGLLHKGPISLMIFDHIPNSMETLFCSHVMTTKFSTWHDRYAVVACVKCCDLTKGNAFTVQWIVNRIQLLWNIEIEIGAWSANYLRLNQWSVCQLWPIVLQSCVGPLFVLC